MLWGEHDDDLGECEEPPPTRAPGTPWYNSETGTKLHWRVWDAWNAPAAVVDIARRGVEWLSKGSNPPPFDGDNYVSVREPRWLAIVLKVFTGFESNGMVEYYEDWLRRNPGGTEEDFAFIVNSIGIVPKKDDPEEGRPVFDFTRSGANGYMLALPFDLPCPATFLAHLCPGYVILKKDCRHGFYLLTLKDNGAGEDGPRRWAGFRHPVTGKLGRFCAPAMGARQAPYFFCMVTRAAVDIFRQHVQLLVAHLRHGATLPGHAPLPPRIAAMIRRDGDVEGLCSDLLRTFVEVYVDDFVCVGPPRGVEAMNIIMEDTGAALGLEYKISKDVCGNEVDVLGAVLRAPPHGANPLDATMTLGDAKAESYGVLLHSVLSTAQAGGTVDGATFDSLVGRLSFAAGISRFARERLLPLYRCTGATGVGSRHRRRSRRVHVAEPDAYATLIWWTAALRGDAGRLSKGRWDVLEEEAACAFPHFIQRQDASGWGWGGRAGADEELERVRAWTTAELTLSITLRELLAAVELFEAAAHMYAGGRVVIETDNTGAAAIINNGSSHVKEGCEMVRRLAKVCDQYGISLRARHVPGTYMMEMGIDGLSRPGKGEPPNTAICRALWMEAAGRPDVARLIAADEEPGVEEDHKFAPFNNYNNVHKHTLDVCCDKYGFNAQPGCTHPFHEGRSAVTHWEEMIGHTLWANPPFSAAGDVIKAVVKAYSASPTTTRATFILPIWSTAQWYQKYISRGILEPVGKPFKKGQQVFTRPVTGGAPSRHRRPSGGLKWELGVFRLGAW